MVPRGRSDSGTGRTERVAVRVVVAPDKFAGTLSASEAASAIAEGWHRHAPADELDLVPMADGGPGFLDVVEEAVGGRRQTLDVTGPYGAPVRASILIDEGVGYVEAAQACGLHLAPQAARDPERATSRGVGELVRTAAAHCERIVIGLGGSGTNDGGAGLLDALGAEATPPGCLREGPRGLASLERIDVAPARAVLDGVAVTLASDVDNPLLGLIGATATYGPQKGLAEDRLMWVEGVLERYAAAVDRRLSLSPGAGAAGGLGFALLVLGAHRVAGVEVVADAVGLRDKIALADLVVTGEGAFDFSSRSGKVPYGVAAAAAALARPCIALAGRVDVGSREMRALGMESAYSMVDLVGEARSLEAPYAALADLAHRVARSWSTSST